MILHCPRCGRFASNAGCTHCGAKIDTGSGVADVGHLDPTSPTYADDLIALQHTHIEAVLAAQPDMDARIDAVSKMLDENDLWDVPGDA